MCIMNNDNLCETDSNRFSSLQIKASSDESGPVDAGELFSDLMERVGTYHFLLYFAFRIWSREMSQKMHEVNSS